MPLASLDTLIGPNSEEKNISLRSNSNITFLESRLSKINHKIDLFLTLKSYLSP